MSSSEQSNVRTAPTSTPHTCRTAIPDFQHAGSPCICPFPPFPHLRVSAPASSPPSTSLLPPGKPSPPPATTTTTPQSSLSPPPHSSTHSPHSSSHTTPTSSMASSYPPLLRLPKIPATKLPLLLQLYMVLNLGEELGEERRVVCELVKWGYSRVGGGRKRCRREVKMLPVWESLVYRISGLVKDRGVGLERRREVVRWLRRECGLVDRCMVLAVSQDPGGCISFLDSWSWEQEKLQGLEQP